MIRLQQRKKAEAEAQAAAAAENAMNVEGEESKDTDSGSGGGGRHILGIGGRKTKKGPAAKSRQTAGEIRIQKDIAELDGGKVADIVFPDPNNLTNFTVKICPDSGLWKGANYQFQFVVPAHYPHDPPKVTCLTKIYHPNINLQGNVCLNILREDWKPVLDINSVIYGLCFLFYEPNPEDPLNHEAAQLYRDDYAQFQRIVKRTLQGGAYQGETFERLI